jgi:SAM-dependent methyltransferase
MFITKNFSTITGDKDSFDWKKFFENESDFSSDNIDILKIFNELRDHLTEKNSQFGLVFNSFMKSLLRGTEFKSKIKVLEVGSGTGFLTRWLLSNYTGEGCLVDSCNESFKAFKAIEDISHKIDFIQSDVFELDIKETFDIVCSFGLIEHFEDKTRIMDVHKKYMESDGWGIIIVPLDSPLSRCFFEVHPELNLGYRELLTEREFRNILTDNNLDIHKIVNSKGYVYDFIAALVKKND